MPSKYVIVNREDTIIEELKNANQNLQAVNESVITADTNNQQKLDTLNTSVNTADTNNQQKLDTLNTSVNTADTNNQQKLDTLNTSVNTADANNVSEFNELQELQKYSNEQLDSLGVKTSTIIAQTQQIDADLLTQTNKIDASINTADTNNQQKLDTLNTSVSSADTNIQAKLDAVNSSMNDVKSSVYALETMGGIVSGELPAQTAELQQLSEHFETLNNSILVSEKDGQTETVISVLNKILEALPSISSPGGGGLKSKTLVDITSLIELEDMTYRTAIDPDMLPKVYAFHLKLKCDVYYKTETKKGVLVNMVLRPPFERYSIINSDDVIVSEYTPKYYPAQNVSLYATLFLDTETYETCTISLPTNLIGYDEALTAWSFSEVHELKLTAYYFDSTPVDAE